MENLSKETLKLLANSLYGCRNPHKLPKDSELAKAIIEHEGSLSHESMERFRDKLNLELTKRWSAKSKRAEELQHTDIETFGFPVIFIKEADGNVFAFFPSQQGDSNPNHKTSYTHIGQHSACHIEYAQECAAQYGLAKEEEYKALQSELGGRGYNNLNVLNQYNKFDIPLNMAGDRDPLTFLDERRIKGENGAAYKYEFVGTDFVLQKL